MGVLGIGGLFFRANDPETLSQWYQDHLGVGAGCVAEGAGDVNEWCWMAQGGPVVFAPFPSDSGYFATDKAFMLNLRVEDMDGLLEQLNAAGIVIETREEWDSPETGRFARIHDPEGNPIELWEAPAEN
ncbi:glyoxalase/bleomycin resistance/dioxygenase family protein [Stakelama sediminis]|uniref:Putative enzyme related to lactoylglutathione lyase n=1 Tax=Stakelama sediminis TaxID=463200 RepID=A0A840YVF8_9SPHN|nr:VOC family protein [Stakelama sediminis]MBB5717540.1 putative enzyme related to lactoylglutathione lyase [Stakelama sediminis]